MSPFIQHRLALSRGVFSNRTLSSNYSRPCSHPVILQGGPVKNHGPFGRGSGTGETCLVVSSGVDQVDPSEVDWLERSKNVKPVDDY